MIGCLVFLGGSQYICLRCLDVLGQTIATSVFTLALLRLLQHFYYLFTK